MGAELLEPLAKWGAVLIGGALAIFTAWYRLKKGVRAEVESEQANARNKALEVEAKRGARIRENDAARRARLERIVREADD